MAYQAASFGAMALAQALLYLWGGALGASAAQQLAAVLLGCGLGAAAVLWVSLDSQFRSWSWPWVFGLALATRLIAIQAAPLLEDDHYRYLWDGLRTATAFDPYRLPPSAFFGDLGGTTLPPAWQDVLSGINNPDVPTLYGPLLQGLFAFAYWLAPADVKAVQALLLVADLAVLALLAKQGAGQRAVLVLAVHPVVLKEAMASAHPDGLLALFLLLACAAWQRRRAVQMGAFLGLAVCTKVAALVALPLLAMAPAALLSGKRAPAKAWFESWLESWSKSWSKSWPLRASAGFCATLAALYLPFVWLGGNELAGLSTFAAQWRYNPLGYRLVESVVPAGVARPVAAALLAFLLVATMARWRAPARKPGATAFAWPAPTPVPPPVHQALLLLVLLSPVVNPWYWLWVLALSLHMRQGWLAVAVLASPLAYLNSTVLAEAGVSASLLPAQAFSVLWPASLVQMLTLVLAWRWRQRLKLT